MRKLVAAMALGLIAYGGAELEVQAKAVRAVHEVQMVLTDAGEYRYVPDQLTIKVGDTVRWINASGGPHNVQFRADGIPAGAADVLDPLMPGKIGPLNGGLLIAPNATYEITFDGVPTGDYFYVCTPHELLDMVATLTVEE